MLLLVGFGLWQALEDAWYEAGASSRNLVAALARSVATNVGLADRAIQNARAGLALTDLAAYPRDVRQFILFGKGRASPYVDRVFVLDVHGHLAAESSGTISPGADFSDRSYFRYWRLHDDDTPYLSAPLLSRFLNGSETVVLSRRVDHDGLFAGIVAVTMPLKALQPTVEMVSPGAKGAINIFALDGTVLARNPAIRAGADHNIAGTPTFERIKRDVRGSFVGRSAVDGEQRLYTFDRAGSFPLIVDVAVSTDAILKPWWHRALPPIFATLALCAGVIALAMLFQRELLRREHVEAELAGLAATDALTGLSNRRSFDAALEREWRRASRTGSPLSVLMIDVDHFKAYNDYYGHVAGDKALRQIADLIAAAARRDADQAARLGGEEFALLLPDTDMSGATSCATRLLGLLQDEQLEHRQAPAGIISVSIGVSGRIAGIDNVQDLMLSADKALYRAKAGGRARFYGEGEE
ncbi:GGDEF domain-containing protein [Sphingomonas abietis]|uniref:diguanylate cyclase n=1 Tax=Sphingomonas abietis TaxID=3012344 RepID=A0ABY7NS61_9SPHN|nr:diguanylate cyclase [Sphingomonas abietis]WBO24379.1 diguanylate cyclase [Sphingomonas abietis]